MLACANYVFLLFCLSFAFEPIAGSAKVYWYIMALFAVVGVFAFVCFMVVALTGGIPVSRVLTRSKSSMLMTVSIYVFGLVVSYIYQSSLLGFWMLLIALELANYFIVGGKEKV